MADIQVRTLYAFDSTDGGELSFGADEVLTITRQDIGDGWWEARNQQGQEGLIPEAYVEIMSLPEPSMPPPPPPPATYLQQNNVGPPSTGPPSLGPPSTGPPSLGPPSLGPPSMGPPSSGPASSGPSSWSSGPSSMGPPVSGGWGQPVPVPAAAPYKTDQSAGLKNQDSYEDWDDDWDDDDSSSTTSERPDHQGHANKHSGSSEGSKFGTVRKSLNRFNAFSKQGGDAYLFGTLTTPVPDSEKRAIVVETADGPFWKPIDRFTCIIASPKKETKFHGMKSYIAYQITPTFSNIQVSRRYKHFDWLHDRLVDKYTIIAVPPLPDKQIAGRYEEDFIQERMRQLQLWIDRMCRHPVIAHSEVFQHFLTCTDEKRWKVGKRNAEKDEYKGGKFFLTMQTPGAPLDHKNVEGQIERFGRFVKSMDDSVKHLCQVGESNMKKHQGSFKKEYQKLGHSFISLARSFEFDSRPEVPPSLEEAAHNLTQAMHNTGQTYDDIGKLFDEQPRYDMCPLLENLQEYKGLLSTFPDVLGVHKAASQKMEEQFAKLSESEAQAVQGKVEVISYACLAEMNQFQQFRVGDFKIMMQNYLKGQIEFYQKITDMLQSTLKHYDSA